MNLVDLQKKLLAAARTDAPGDHVPYAFEKRVTALLVSRVAADNVNLWVRGLWRRRHVRDSRVRGSPGQSAGPGSEHVQSSYTTPWRERCELLGRQAAMPFILITVLLGAWAVFNSTTTVATGDDFSQNFENTLLASVDQSDQTQ